MYIYIVWIFSCSQSVLSDQGMYEYNDEYNYKDKLDLVGLDTHNNGNKYDLEAHNGSAIMVQW